MRPTILSGPTREEMMAAGATRETENLEDVVVGKISKRILL